MSKKIKCFVLMLIKLSKKTYLVEVEWETWKNQKLVFYLAESSKMMFSINENLPFVKIGQFPLEGRYCVSSFFAKKT